MSSGVEIAFTLQSRRRQDTSGSVIVDVDRVRIRVVFIVLSSQMALDSRFSIKVSPRNVSKMPQRRPIARSLPS